MGRVITDMVVMVVWVGAGGVKISSSQQLTVWGHH